MADILIPFDFSKNATIAMDQALLLAAAGKKKVEVLHITNDIVSKEYPASWKYDHHSTGIIKEKIEDLVAKRIEKLNLAASPRMAIKIKEAATISGGMIAHMLQSGSRLLVMGTHGSSGVYDKIFGSNTSVMVNHSLFPVLVIPHSWKPVTIENCIATIKLNKLASVSASVKKWGKFFNCPVEAIQFTILREAEGEYANKTKIDNIPCRLIINPAETTLAEDILTFSKSLKRTVLLLFTREKTFLEKLLKPNLTYRLSGNITIPLLAVPLEGYEQ